MEYLHIFVITLSKKNPQALKVNMCMMQLITTCSHNGHQVSQSHETTSHNLIILS